MTNWKYFSFKRLVLTNVDSVAKIIPTAPFVAKVKTLGEAVSGLSVVPEGVLLPTCPSSKHFIARQRPLGPSWDRAGSCSSRIPSNALLWHKCHVRVLGLISSKDTSQYML